MENKRLKFQKCKKGFTLVECVVSISLIVIVSICAYSTILFANTAMIKDKIINFAIGDIDNAMVVLDASSGITSFSLGEFNNNMNFAFDNNVVVENVSATAQNLTLTKDENNNYATDGNVKVVFNISIESDKVVLNANVLFNDKVVYSLSKPYTKVVI